ncbi:hypothetical protein [Rufibacter tibetensis]|uniref:Uncharacterized protein n=1 Tax=Rufibacter tibetensis TaxID=512763 RepID=A0A0P0CIP9_9BACT|nr:hypothetical protein [Rufibacter tibetensis]ALI99259.1 hypothetical protein DC20_10075 [Rufibacter tibetensis]
MLVFAFAVTTGNFFTHEDLIWKISLAFYPLGIATGLAIGTRQYNLTINDVDNLLELNDWVMDYLAKAWYKIQSSNTQSITLISQKAGKRLLRRLFPSESITINSVNHTLSISGPYRTVHEVEAKLKFGKVSVR